MAHWQTVVGDWNGDGIRTIGIFNEGKWTLDLNGDGIFDGQDVEFRFGTANDIPLGGDFNGDGIEELALYRQGTWIIDTNSNHQCTTEPELGLAMVCPVKRKPAFPCLWLRSLVLGNACISFPPQPSSNYNYIAQWPKAIGHPLSCLLPPSGKAAA